MAKIIETSSDSAAAEDVKCPCSLGQITSLWNPTVLSTLNRKYIPESRGGHIFRVDSSLPVIEFFLPRPQDWDGSPALTQGRVYANFDQPSEGLRKWFDAVARWSFAKCPVSLTTGYIGPAALKWHEDSGLLLPMIRPPVNDQWRALLQPQLDRFQKSVMNFWR